MEPRQFISVAASAVSSALAVFGGLLIFAEALELPVSPSNKLPSAIAALLHPGVWYVLAAVTIRQLGRHVSK